jgi:hypothetical protein
MARSVHCSSDGIQASSTTTLLMLLKPPHDTPGILMLSFFAWLGRNRRLAKDFEGTVSSATAVLYAASVMLLTRRVARSV